MRVASTFSILWPRQKPDWTGSNVEVSSRKLQLKGSLSNQLCCPNKTSWRPASSLPVQLDPTMTGGVMRLWTAAFLSAPGEVPSEKALLIISLRGHHASLWPALISHEGQGPILQVVGHTVKSILSTSSRLS